MPVTKFKNSIIGIALYSGWGVKRKSEFRLDEFNAGSEQKFITVEIGRKLETCDMKFEKFPKWRLHFIFRTLLATNPGKPLGNESSGHLHFGTNFQCLLDEVTDLEITKAPKKWPKKYKPPLKSFT